MKNDFAIRINKHDYERISKMTRSEVAKFLKMSSEDIRRMGIKAARRLLDSSAIVSKKNRGDKLL